MCHKTFTNLLILSYNMVTAWNNDIGISINLKLKLMTAKWKDLCIHDRTQSHVTKPILATINVCTNGRITSLLCMTIIWGVIPAYAPQADKIVNGRSNIVKCWRTFDNFDARGAWPLNSWWVRTWDDAEL